MGTWRDSRLSELVALKVTDPARLIFMYRNVAGLTVDGQLPHNASFMYMIEAILNFEEAGREADGASAGREARGVADFFISAAVGRNDGTRPGAEQ
jgi:hypothetical protein